MSRAICTNDRIMHIARNPRQVRIARKVQKVHIPRNMYPNGQNAMLCAWFVKGDPDELLKALGMADKGVNASPVSGMRRGRVHTHDMHSIAFCPLGYILRGI